MNRLPALLILLLTLGCSSTEPTPNKPTVKVRTQGYLVNQRMSITDFEAKNIGAGNILTFRNGEDTLTEATATAGYLILSSLASGAPAYMDPPEEVTITVPADTADSAAYKTFVIPTPGAIDCLADSAAAGPSWGGGPILNRVLLVDSVTNTYSDFFEHDSTDPSGSQFYATLWVRDTVTGNPQPDVSLGVEFRTAYRLEENVGPRGFWLKGIPPTFKACRFTAE